MPVYRRTFLVRQVQIWDFDPPDGLDLDGDFGAFDDALCDQGEVIDDYTELIDDDDLTVEEENP